MSGPLLWGAIAVAGGLGAYARFRLDGAIARRARGAFPWGTFTVNVSGALAAGLVAGAGVTGALGTLLAVGVIGSFTTFSTWLLEAQRLAEEGRIPLAAATVAAGACAGLGAALAGWAIGGMA